MRYAPTTVVAALFVYCNVLPAQAQGVVTLVCSRTHDGPPASQIEIDYDRSTVLYGGGRFSARVSENQIVWEKQRQESGGATMVGYRATLNRTTGVLSTENLCLAKDMAWGCNPGGSLEYCKRATRQF
jgi:hypothetical protein